MITEFVVRVILHCSRCNTAFRDDDYDGVVLWTQEELAEAFPADFDEWTDCQGWIRLGERVLCFDCWEFEDEDTDDEARCEKGPLPAADADGVAREQAGYAHADRHILDLGERRWSIQHPVSCRPDLFSCAVNQAATRDLNGPPAELGRFVCGLDSEGLLVIHGPAVEVTS